MRVFHDSREIMFTCEHEISFEVKVCKKKKKRQYIGYALIYYLWSVNFEKRVINQIEIFAHLHFLFSMVYDN